MSGYVLYYIVLETIHRSLDLLTVGPDVQSQSPSHLIPRGVAMETEEQELYLLCLCEQPLTGGSSRKKKGKEIFIGFFVSCKVTVFACFFTKSS